MTILNEIVSRTQRDLGDRRAKVSESDLRMLPLFSDERRSFDDSLSAEGLGVIAEIKSASPSKGVIRSDLDVTDTAQQYAESGAAAISVLTEPHYFQGRLGNLGEARAVVSTPLLRKDFVLDPYQVVEARAYGADAVLLIATCLGKSQLDELLHACEDLGMGHLVEVYSHHDLEKIAFERVKILGVNSRDLQTFEVDLDRLASIFADVPRGLIRVAESGITDTEDLRKVIGAGVDAILVGEALMRADKPGEALRSLLASARALEADHTIEEDR